MEHVIKIFILLPLGAFAVSLFIPRKREELLAAWVYGTAGMHMLGFQVFAVYWLWRGMPTINIPEIVVYRSDNYTFLIDFYFDKVTAVYLFTGSMLTFLVTLYSRYYLHREPGYKRFFNTILFFYLGYNLILFSGNFETLFVGWEILGISSFLLIAFYRDRYLPVKNAVKVFSIYRVGDVGLILAMWMSHHLFDENIAFLKLNNYELVSSYLQQHSLVGIGISLALLISAAAKSAQLPFSTWLPRAMEGPTPSSAIFYGSLSVHMGVFLLMRTFPLWEHQLSVRIVIGLLGLLTAIAATGMARVQSSVKSQIAYASIAQIGLIFIEVALGWHYVALLHFAGNAFLRTYQLLVSPSVVSYRIREQFYHFIPRQHTIEDSLPRRLEYSVYILCLKEMNLDALMYNYLWNPLKYTGKKLGQLTTKKVMWLFIPVYLAGVVGLMKVSPYPQWIYPFMPVFFSVLGVVLVLRSFTERIHARMAWIMVILNHYSVALAVAYNETAHAQHFIMYLSGVTVFGLIGYFVLRKLKYLEGSIDLDRFHGHVYKHPKLALVLLICSLGVSGFPISPTFVGEDLIFMHIHTNQIGIAFLLALSFVVDGLAIIRIYARVFLGPHSKSVYEMAYRSS
jgi:NADH:ubiquinone oxidoreductase subunit 5 (subunit L)/multisubunit Na+/H+ antiporter MnhA subunit